LETRIEVVTSVWTNEIACIIQVGTRRGRPAPSSAASASSSRLVQVIRVKLIKMLAAGPKDHPHIKQSRALEFWRLPSCCPAPMPPTMGADPRLW
jgi:hypothetical protein